MNLVTRLLLLFVVVLLSLQSLAPNAGVAAEQQRPNILFAFADDWGRLASAYRQANDPSLNDVVSTPNFDRVAKQGVLFNNAFVNAPSCTPCRSSILSGQHFWRTGRAAILQGAEWDSSIPAWPLLLEKDANYHLGKTWKVWSPGSPADAPYGGQAHAYQSSGNRFNGFSQTATKLVAEGSSVEEAKRQLFGDVRQNFREFLADGKEGQPFSYWFGPTNVHRKWVKGSGQQLWGISPDSLKGLLPPFLPDVPTVREDMADYLGEAQAFDAALGVLLDELERAGQLENTLVVVSGDHGPPGFPHGKCNLYDFGTQVALAIAGPNVVGGRVVDDFVSLPDLAPTFLEAGGVEVPAVMTAHSLWPVLESKQEGLVDSHRTQVFTGRERHVAGAREDFLPYPQRAIRTADYALVVNFHPERYPLGDHYRLDGDDPPSTEEVTENTFATLPDEDAGPTKAWLVDHRNEEQWKPYFDHAYGRRPREELFDLRQDPHQMKNVAGDPEYATVLAELRERLMTELEQSNDPRLVDNGKFFETPPMAGPLPEVKRKAKRKRKN